MSGRRVSEALTQPFRERGGDVLYAWLRLADALADHTLGGDRFSSARLAARAEEAGWGRLLADLGGLSGLARPDRLAELEPGGPANPLAFWLDAAFGLTLVKVESTRSRDPGPNLGGISTGDVTPPRARLLLSGASLDDDGLARVARLAGRLLPAHHTAPTEGPALEILLR